MLKSLISKLRSECDFSKRIKYRHAKFWNDPNAENVRNTILHAYSPLYQWTDCENWQRKLSNKYNAREFAKMHGCKVPNLFWRGRDIDKVNFDFLPENYVIRPTIGHSCQSVFLMNKNLNLFDNKTYSLDQLKMTLNDSLSQNQRLEYLIEEFLPNENGEHKILKDYKIFTFNGRIAAILQINRISPKEGFQSCYTEDWQPLEPLVSTYPKGPYEYPPECLPEMIAGAKKLSKTYKTFVRVDFYASIFGAVFGEFSPTPILGNGSTRFANKLFISYWDKYCCSLI
jgi:hypothetical protein